MDEEGDEDVPPSDLPSLIRAERVLEEVGVVVAKIGDDDGLLAVREKMRDKGLREEKGDEDGRGHGGGARGRERGGGR